LAARQPGILARKHGGAVQAQEPFENVQTAIAFETEPDDCQRRFAHIRAIEMGVRFLEVYDECALHGFLLLALKLLIMFRKYNCFVTSYTIMFSNFFNTLRTLIKLIVMLLYIINKIHFKTKKRIT
jgi:hypothetical protein